LLLLLLLLLLQVCVELPTSADSMAQAAIAAARRAAARLLLTAGRAAIDRYLLAAGPTTANLQQRPDETGGQTDVQTVISGRRHQVVE